MYEIGEEFEGEYPQEAADACNEAGDRHIEEIECIGNLRMFKIVENEGDSRPPTEIENLRETIAEQDAAICELYEMIEELRNGR